MAKALDVYAIVDQTMDALSYLGQSLVRHKPSTKVKAAIDTYTHCQKWLIEHGHQNTFIDLRMRADQMIANRDLLKSVPCDEETWAYYLAHMPAYSAAMDSMISDNHELNAMVVQAVARDECKTDPYVMPDFCALLLKHRDWQSWQSYIVDRRHNDNSKIPVLRSLNALHPDDLPSLKPFLCDFLNDHPWKKNVLFKDICGLRHEDMFPLYEVAIATGHHEIADNLFMGIHWDNLPIKHLQYFVQNRQQVFNLEWRMSAISKANTDSHRGNHYSHFDAYVCLAYAAFCGITQEKNEISILNQNSNGTTHLKLLTGISKMKREYPDLFSHTDLAMVSEVAEKYLILHPLTQDEVHEIFCESYQIDNEFYVHTNSFKRLCLSDDLGL